MSADLVAGLSIALVLIPQSLAYAAIAGLPPERGLLASVLPVLVGGLAGASRYLQTGPTALTSLLAFGAVVPIATPGSDRYVGAMIVLAVVVGLARIGISLLRLAGVANLLSHSVVIGFSAAAGVLILASQVPPLAGVGAADRNPIAAALEVLTQPGSWSVASLAIGLGGVALLILARRVHPLLPGPLLAAVLGTAVGLLLDHDAPVLGPVQVPLPFEGVTIQLGDVASLIVPGLVIAVVGFAEAATLARRNAAIDRERWDASREFLGQGLANIASAASGGFPVGGSFARTSLARLAGARSRWVFAWTAIGVLVAVPLLPALAPLPLAILSAVILVAVVPLVDVGAFAYLWRVARLQAGVALLTFGATLLAAPRIELGVLAGVAAATAAHLFRENRVHARARVDAADLHLHPAGVLYFGSAPRLQDALLRSINAHPGIERLVVHLGGLGRIDVTGALVLRDLLHDARAAGLRVEFREIPEHSRRIVERVVLPELGSGE